MTVNELKKELDKIIKKGGGNTKVYFDTEAACFDYHIVGIKSIYYCTEMEEDYVSLHCNYSLYNHVKNKS